MAVDVRSCPISPTFASSVAWLENRCNRGESVLLSLNHTHSSPDWVTEHQLNVAHLQFRTKGSVREHAGECFGKQAVLMAIKYKKRRLIDILLGVRAQPTAFHFSLRS